MIHSADWRRNVEMQFWIATTASFVVLSVGFGWLRPHRFRHHVTWLILPVVICLSQRLSHACLSISILLRNCEWLIKTVIVFLMATYYLDNYGNSRANTCLQTRLLGRVVLIRYLTNPGLLVLSWFIIFVRIVFWRRIIQVSDLSAFDGRVLAYRGIDG